MDQIKHKSFLPLKITKKLRNNCFTPQLQKGIHRRSTMLPHFESPVSFLRDASAIDYTDTKTSLNKIFKMG
jgi:hypothetical protein